MLRNKRRENSFSCKKVSFRSRILQVSSSQWTQDMLVVLNCLITWRLFSDLALWSSPISFLSAKICLCLRVSCWLKIFLRNLWVFICFQENFCLNKGIMIGVLEPLNQCCVKLVVLSETQKTQRCTKILFWWEPWEISIFLRSSLTISLSSWDLFQICSLTPRPKIRRLLS